VAGDFDPVESVSHLVTVAAGAIARCCLTADERDGPVKPRPAEPDCWELPRNSAMSSPSLDCWPLTQRWPQSVVLHLTHSV
jgi:hypothetical protein